MRSRRLASMAFCGLLLGLALFFGLWRFQCIVPFGWQQDEGAPLTSALAISEGHPLYSSVESLNNPLLLEFLGLLFRLLGPSLLLARAFCIVLAAAYLVDTGITTRYVSWWVGGVAAAGALLVDGELFRGAGFALSEVPALFFASVAVLLAMLYLNSRKRIYLGGAAITASLGTLIKFDVPFFPAWIALVVWAATGPKDLRQWRCSWRRFVADATLAAAFFILPFALSFLLYDARAFLDSAFLARIRLRGAEGWCAQCNLDILLAYFRANWGIVLLAVAGTFLNVTGNPKSARARILMWLLLVVTLAGLWLHSPLFERHCVALSLPLSILAGMSIASWVHMFSRKKVTARLLVGVPVMVLAAFFAVNQVLLMNAWCALPTRHDQGGPEAAAICLLDQITVPAEIIASDDLVLAFIAGRRVPPQLSDVSHARNLSQHLGMGPTEVIDALRLYDIQTLILWTRRFDDLPGFVQWAQDHFVSVSDFGEGRRILYGRRYASPDEIPGLRPVPGVTLGEDVALVGYRLEPETLRPGDQARLTLYWRALSPISQDYQVMVHLAQPGAPPVVQGDSSPLNGLYPTTRWRPREILADVHRLTLPPDTPPRQYELLTGMYDLGSLKRLPVRQPGSTGPQDAVRLTTVTVAQ